MRVRPDYCLELRIRCGDSNPRETFDSLYCLKPQIRSGNSNPHKISSALYCLMPGIRSGDSTHNSENKKTLSEPAMCLFRQYFFCSERLLILRALG